MTTPKDKVEADRVEGLKRQTAVGKKAVAAGYVVTGVRLSNPKDDHASGVTVAFDPKEQKAIVKAVNDILNNRK